MEFTQSKKNKISHNFDLYLYAYMSLYLEWKTPGLVKINRICGLMICVVATSAIDRGFDSKL